MLSRLGGWFVRFWAWATRRASRLQRRADARTRQLQAEARLLGAEVQQIGAAFWDKIDALPFVHARMQFPRVKTQYYGHGAFMGAAPALLADPAWRRILAFLMPDVFDAVRAKLDAREDVSALMTMMENNPVLAAFGTVKSAQASGADEHPNHLVGMEWDLFVDTALIEARAQAATPEAQSAVMDKVLDTALIAHAGTVDTVQESMGISQYADVRATPKTEFGGVEMDAWLDLFGRALALSGSADFDATVREMAKEPRCASDEACMLNTFASPWPVEKVVREYQRVTGRPYISIIIDIKSLSSTPDFLSALVRHLNQFGVHIAAVGSFHRAEISGVSATAQRVGGLTLPGAREVLFFHFAGELQAACAEGSVPSGQSVMFNGASLVDFKTLSAGRHVYSARLTVLRELEALRKSLDLHIGFYVQEGDCEAAAASVLSDVVDAWPDTFELGFAWGGLRDEAGLPPADLARAGYGAQAYLLLVGKTYQWESKPPP